MTPEAMAAIHALAFADARGWSAEEIAGLIAAPGGFCITDPAGFALGRVVVDEAELLTIAVAPDHRRAGLGRSLLARFEAEAIARGARLAFLEVAQDNSPAVALYTAAGWREAGRRKGYYARASGAVDALMLTRNLRG